ncbi:MAG: phenylalanine--tRNA ligase subunit beta [Candidatus Taylorbacteria bacterium RIFCSPHIGHO2_01_FULL_45_63]|uniref:Phenylalanine--tRNA ligase beta subunit n=1 Tax=Candidatus Taylorbacteria bacterium RIFCSPHIGHO2_02_FULL_45_35 TaxID=1802311 RepID=A0A1G2MQT9_9BACT|nr:MAG: phenylalanine--tRNA ligase subunit beta [Candidatus Taylorbacteria bacterium RIFCSPHIGHO2_01_FULL_45_63]OHA26114.1 MAG: phenylalanine--tRNA ligase subunit beta [Candidatus Taylorbacteria bacterium RIFCSPHIGHO2_02_FULL_45_35]OHA32538.1 MAG: phenylalanine--tRNA ligase subunit beta [Candidatus Taylorbacteria bacterium RIFCSPLOWO2_01_FULL_45_34b]
MKISHNWLQDYFDKELPSPEKLAELLNAHVFEVEGLDKVHEDTILDVKVLPDRAHYALSHFGIAYEVSAITGIPLKKERDLTVTLGKQTAPKVTVEDEKVCRRYMARVVEGIGKAETPKIIKERLAAIGQRSINPIVDLANYTMFDVGQPLHAFDADKVKGGITVRKAKAGEKITTLDNKDVALSADILVIADDVGPLAIAGIKGGKRAEVDSNTKRIILESATFDPVLIRKTATALNIKTDASKRFENNMPPAGAFLGILHFSKRLEDIFGDSISFSPFTDIYPVHTEDRTIEIDLDFIHAKLGAKVSEKEVIEILGRLYLKAENKKGRLVVTVPAWRQDVVIPEDAVEEVGRLYGYEKIKPIVPPKVKGDLPLNKNFYYANKIKLILANHGFSEIYTSTFDKVGEREVLYPVASDKNFLRTELTKSMAKALEFNLRNTDLLNLNQIKLFEIGKIFKDGKEINSLVVGITNTKSIKTKVNDLIRDAREMLIKELGADVQTVCTIDDSGGLLLLGGQQIGTINAIDGVMEVNLDLFIASLPDPKGSTLQTVRLSLSSLVYRPFSKYPFIVRDVAIFVPESTKVVEVLAVIKKETSTLLVNDYLFDEFKKGDKISYAFRLVFQSFEKTLTDDEVNRIMKKVAAAVTAMGWQVR